MFGLPPPIPEPAYEVDDEPAYEGDMVVFPVPQGRRVTLSFAGPYEGFLTLDDKRVIEHSDGDTRRLLLWQSRHLPALYRVLEQRYGVAGVLTGEGVVLVDGVELQTSTFLDHGRLRQLLGPVRARLPAFAILGPIGTRAELSHRLRGMFASGTHVEVRCEEEGRVTSRRRLQVGRS